MSRSAPTAGLAQQSIENKLDTLSPEQVIEWALSNSQRPLLSTSFGPQAGVLLHAVLSIDASVPVLWVDHGFNTQATYRFAKRLIERFDPDLHIYSSKHSSAWILSTLGGVPDLQEPAHAEFAQRVKLEPFERALQELQPDLWLTGKRRDETAHRRSLSVLSEGRPGLPRVAPFFHFSEQQMDDYLLRHSVPTEHDYFDPTKGLGNRECGLHAAS